MRAASITRPDRSDRQAGLCQPGLRHPGVAASSCGWQQNHESPPPPLTVSEVSPERCRIWVSFSLNERAARFSPLSSRSVIPASNALDGIQMAVFLFSLSLALFFLGLPHRGKITSGENKNIPAENNISGNKSETLFFQLARRFPGVIGLMPQINCIY